MLYSIHVGLTLFSLRSILVQHVTHTNVTEIEPVLLCTDT